MPLFLETQGEVHQKGSLPLTQYSKNNNFKMNMKKRKVKMNFKGKKNTVGKISKSGCLQNWEFQCSFRMQSEILYS